jgi:benzoylsuccinyl-CoA thiolase BbsB subunit
LTRAVVVGTESVPCGKYPDASPLDLEFDCITRACASVGLSPRDLGAVVVVPPGYRRGFAQLRAQRLCERLGCSPSTLAEVEIGGLSSLFAFRVLCAEIEAGRVEVGVVVGAQSERTLGVDAHEIERFIFLNSSFGQWLGPYGIGGALPCYALSAQRYMHEHGVSAEEVAQVVVTLQSHAASNPRAELRDEITVSDVLSSRVVAPPIHLYEAAPWSDGACAVVVASSSWASSRSLDGAAVTGWGEKHSPGAMIPFGWGLAEFPWIGESTSEALSRAGRTLDDVDVAEVYGAFAASELMTYEAMGFCGPGEAAGWVASGASTYGGDVVVNPSGGRLCLGHPPPATPLYEVEEIFEQLTGKAGSRQVPGASVGLVQAEHGMMNGSGVAVLEA